jgi:hypothetical protein
MLERSRAEDRLEIVHRELLEASRLSGMAEVATGVLHNVGNVLNSVNVSTTQNMPSRKRSCPRKLWWSESRLRIPGLSG